MKTCADCKKSETYGATSYCQNCNIGLGGFRDDPAKLEAAIEYINTTRRLEDIK